jgi:hypothetical protein
MTLLRLKAIDAQQQALDLLVLVLQTPWILLPGRQHLLITPQVLLDRIRRQDDPIAVPQLGPNLRHRPVTCETPMTDPTEHIPTNHPPRQADRHLGFGTEGLGMAGASLVGAMHQLIDQMHWPTEGENPVMPMIAHTHPAPTDLAVPVLDLQFQACKDRLLRPTIRHRLASLQRILSNASMPGACLVRMIRA